MTLGMPSVFSSASSSSAPGRNGHGFSDLPDDAAHQGLDDLLSGQVEAGLTHHSGGDDQLVADEFEPLLFRPGQPVGVHELGLGADPIRLGVDEGSVHVPQDGGRVG
jgi:hypothetical protein